MEDAPDWELRQEVPVPLCGTCGRPMEYHDVVALDHGATMTDPVAVVLLSHVG